MKVPLIIMAVLLVCALIYVGVLSFSTYTYTSNLPGGYGENVIYDISTPLNDFMSVFNKIGELGQDVMESVNISSMPTRLYKLKYDVISNGATVGYAYIIVYGSLRLGVEQFDEESVVHPYLFKIFAFKDVTLSGNPAYNRLNYYINTLSYDYLCTYYDTDYNNVTTRDLLVTANDDYEYLKTNVINVIHLINELGISITDFIRGTHISNAEIVYKYNSAELFDTSELVNGSYIMAK